MKTILNTFFVVLLVLPMACSSSKSTSSDSTTAKNDSANKIENFNPASDLVEQLRRIPGISVTGSGNSARVTIRGMSSFSSDTEPLFVVNGTPLNGGLSAASNMVSVSDINSIRVLKTPSETSFYGIRGSNGVIVINLKQ